MSHLDPTPPSIPQTPNGNDRIWAIACHLSVFLGVGFLLPLIVYLAMRRESGYVADHSREALNFHISVLLYSICCLPLILVFGVGVLLLFAIWLASFILAIVAAIRASNDEAYRYPLTLRLVP